MIANVKAAADIFSHLSDIYKNVRDGVAPVDADKIDRNFMIATNNGNMIKFMSEFILEPTVFVTREGMTNTSIDDIFEFGIDIFSAFYLQTFRMLSDVHGLSTNEIIPAMSIKSSLESVQTDSITMSKLEDLEFFPTGSVDLEAIDAKISTEVKSKSEEVIISHNRVIARQYTIEIFASKKTSTTGDVTTSATSEVRITIPIMIKANVVEVDINSLINSIEHKAEKYSLLNRWLEYKSGGITLSNLLFCADIIDKYKDNKLNKNNISTMLNTAERAHMKISTLKRGIVGLNRVVNTLILTDDESEMLAKSTHTKLSKDRDKDNLLDKFSAMTMLTINPDRERLTVYINSISGSNSVGFKKLSKKGSKDIDIMEMSKLLMMNKFNY